MSREPSSNSSPDAEGAARFFRGVTAHPRWILALALLIVAGAGIWLPGIRMDSSTDAFLPSDHPEVAYQKEVQKTFRLGDSIVALIVNPGPEGVFNPHSLRLVSRLTEQIANLPGMDMDRLTSLATEDSITGDEDGIAIQPFLDDDELTQEQADWVRQAVMKFPLYVGNLVSRDGEAAAIVVEILEGQSSEEIYREILGLVSSAPTEGERIHVAGESAVSAQLGAYINSDMRRLNLLCGLVISVVLFLSYRTWRGLVLPGVVVGGTVAVVIALMVLAGEPFYVITNALPVILIAIGVADGVHILGQYYEEAARRPDSNQRELVIRTMAAMWRPVTVTSVTDAAGFLGLYFSSDMPPMKAFGLFAAIGAGMAWLFSIFALPALLVLLRPATSRAFAGRNGSSPNRLFENSSMGRTGDPPVPSGDSPDGTEATVQTNEDGLEASLPSSVPVGGSPTRAGESPALPIFSTGSKKTSDGFARLMSSIGRSVTRHSRKILAGTVLIFIAGLVGASFLEVNEDRIQNFRESEAIYRANEEVNRRLHGANHLDVVFETSEPEGLYDPVHLQSMEALETFALSLPHVQGTSSILHVLKQINRAFHEDRPEEYRLPESEALVAQYFLLHSAAADPAALDHWVDDAFRRANLRVTLDSGKFTDEKRVVEALQDYIENNFSGSELDVRLSGRVNFDYHWIRRLGENHFLSVGIALAAVGLTLVWSFRSVAAGLLALFPVCLSVLMIYAVMGFAGIWLNIGTSMFAAIAIGTGVDFAVHTVDRLRALLRENKCDLEQALAVLFPSTGRALLFNFLAVMLGFGLLITSHVPPLIQFGALITVSIVSSFVASLTVLPALARIFGPRIVGVNSGFQKSNVKTASLFLVTLLFAGRAFSQQPASESSGTSLSEEIKSLSGDEIARRVNARDEGQQVSRVMRIELVPRSGITRERLTRTFRKNYPDQKRRVIFYLEPANVEGTAFLNYDYFEAGREDDRWLYLPALRKVRRISASNRGDYFLGTDFTYEDINNETKVNIEDYQRRNAGTEEVDGIPCLILEAVPVNESIQKELGYSRVRSWVDPKIWMLRKAEYWDPKGEKLKTVYFNRIQKAQGIWTAHELVAQNHQSGHGTTLTFSDVDYESAVDDALFTQSRLRRGP